MSNSFLDSSLGYLINMSALLLKRELIDEFKKTNLGITPEQWAILSRLKERDNISQRDLAISTFKDNANITRIIDQLEKKGLVERTSHPGDRRAWLLCITKQGKQVVEKLEKCAQAVLVKAQENISDSDLNKCKKVINQLITNIQ